MMDDIIDSVGPIVVSLNTDIDPVNHGETLSLIFLDHEQCHCIQCTD